MQTAILTWLLLLPTLGGLLVLALPAIHAKKARWIALAFHVATGLLAVIAARRFDWTLPAYDGPNHGVQLALRIDWIGALGFQYFVGVDGLSLPLVLLTATITLLACWVSREVPRFTRAYFAALLFLLATTIGLFISLDIFLFYGFFVLSAIPLCFLVSISAESGAAGGTDPAKGRMAALKLFLFMLASSICVLFAIVGIYQHSRAIPDLSMDFMALSTNSDFRALWASGGPAYHFGHLAFWLLVGGFGVRLPLIGLHLWQADAHAVSTTPVSMVLTTTLGATGVCGLLRIGYALLPAQAAHAWFVVALLGVISILYGSMVALAQKDLKRQAAFLAMSLMGYAILGLAVLHPTATTGAVFQCMAASLGTALLFFVIGIIEDRAKHRSIQGLGGIASLMPRFTTWAVISFAVILGMPGLCGFVSILLVLLGIFSAGNPESFLIQSAGIHAQVPLAWLGVLAASTFVINGGCLAWTFQRLFMGMPRLEHQNFPQLTRLETWTLAILSLLCLLLGIFPNLVLGPMRPAIEGLMKTITG